MVESLFDRADVRKLEKDLERKYREGAPQSEIDVLETEYEKLVGEGDEGTSEEDVTPGDESAVSEGISIEEELRHLYQRYLNSDSPKSREDLVETMRSVIQGNDFIYTTGVPKSDVTDDQVLDAAKDVYEHHKHLLKRKRAPGAHPTPESALERLRAIKERVRRKTVAGVIRECVGKFLISFV